MGFWETVVATALGASAPVALAFFLRGLVAAARPKAPTEQYVDLIMEKLDEGSARMVETHKRGEI